MVALVATTVTVYPPYANWPPIRSDGAGYHIWNYAILKGDLSFSWFQGEPSEVALHHPDAGVQRYTCKYPLGVALLRLPVMLFVTDADRCGLPYSPAEHWACLALGAIALVATVLFSLKSCYWIGVPPVWANISVLLLTFGTGLFHYSTYDGGYSHVYSALLVAVLTWLAIRAVEACQPLPVFPVVVLVATLFLVRTTNVVLIGSWATACALYAIFGAARASNFLLRATGGAGIGLLLGLAVTLAVNSQMFGRLTFHTYPGEEFHWNDPRQLSVLFGKEQGLLCSYPVVGLAVIAALFTRRTRIAALGTLLVIAAYVVLYGYWWSWHLGCGFGHRGFVEVIPLLVPVLAMSLAEMSRRGAIAFSVAALVATGYVLVEMCIYWGARSERIATF